MDQEILVNGLIAGGESLLKHLTKEGVPILAAGWVNEAPDGMGFLYIATPLAAEGGSAMAAYKRVNAIRRQMQDGFVVDPLGIKLVSADAPMAKATLEARRNHPGRAGFYYGVGGRMIGGVEVEGFYVYPLEGVLKASEGGQLAVVD